MNSAGSSYNLDLKFWDELLTKFKKRWGLCHSKSHREAGDGNVIGAEAAPPYLQEKLEGFVKYDILNADESGVMYKWLQILQSYLKLYQIEKKKKMHIYSVQRLMD